MSKELECLDRIDKRNYLTEREHKEFLGVVKKALTEYEAIKNAEPTKAMECLETIWCDISTNYINEYVAIKEALQRLEAIDNANPSEALQCLESIEDVLWDDELHYQRHSKLLETIKQALLKAQEPKQYLKWEDLEFNIDKQMMTVLLNGTKYTLIVGRNVHIDKLAFLRNGKINYYFLEADKQFFNDLHLERVEE